MKSFLLLIGLISTCQLQLLGQVFGDTEEQFDSIYAKRILMEEIDDVYIPMDIEDAFLELNRLSSPGDIEKFKNASE